MKFYPIALPVETNFVQHFAFKPAFCDNKRAIVSLKNFQVAVLYLA